MDFPPRTRASDAIIRDLYTQLTAAGTANGGVNRCMVTVVTTDETGDVPRNAFIATSGPNAVAGGLRTAINNLAGNGVYGGVGYTLVQFTGAAIMTNPLGSGHPTLPGDYRRAHARHCAEPKAIETAAATGGVLSGMSTIWWGNNANAFADPNNNALGIFAVPCQVCDTNKDWIMTRANESRMVAKGATRRSLEV